MFTMGTLSPVKTRQLERNSPLPVERVLSIQKAFNSSIKTNLLIEPIEDHKEGIEDLIVTTQDMITGDIYIGPANKRVYYLYPDLYEWRGDLWDKEPLLELKQFIESSLLIDQTKIKWNTLY